ncbi:MAG: putative phosphoesterase [Candidatus Nanohaloarchaea archaeon]|jgi:putative phosphoesterase
MIAVVSDSHIPTRADEIPEKFWEKIEEADITVHAGDYDREETFNALQTYANDFYGVKGNCDFFEADELEQSKTFGYEGFSFGVYHGTGITPRAHTPTLVKIVEEDLDAQILIHGHSHQGDIELEEGKLLLNPGSCTGAGGGTARESNPTMMIVKVEEGGIAVKILELEENELRTIEERSFDAEQIKNSG